MSFVAKVFVVFNLLLSALFLYFAMHVWTAQTKWEKMYWVEKARTVEALAAQQKFEVDLAQRVGKEQQSVAGLKKDLTTVRMEKNTVVDEIIELKSKLTQAENDRQLVNAQKDEVAREKDRLSQELIKARSIILKEMQAYQVALDNATKYKNEKAEMEVQFNQSVGELTALKRDRNKIEQDLSLANARLEKYMITYGPQEMTEDLAMPAIESVVLAVRNDVGLLMLSAGSQQNVKAGYRFTISRGADYIGKVQVEKVYGDMCSAKILTELTNKAGLPFEVHDSAKTR